MSDLCCKYNVGVVCVNPVNCQFCGWNPAVSAWREAKTRAEGLHVDADKIVDAIKRAESAVTTPVRGWWVRNNPNADWASDWHCSRCSGVQDENHLTKYCPECGAEMRIAKGGIGNG